MGVISGGVEKIWNKKQFLLQPPTPPSNLNYDWSLRPCRHLTIILHCIKNVISLTVVWKFSRTTRTIRNINPQDTMLNSLHLLLFWEVHEKGTTVDASSRTIILTRRSKRRPLIKAINVQLNVKLNSWKSCLLKERKR